MRLKDIKIGTKLSLAFGIVAIIAVIVGIIGYSEIGILSTNMNNIGLNRMPDLTDYLNMNTERMKVRAQTLEVWVYENTPDARREFGEIVSQRKSTWRDIDKIYASIQSRPRQSERGRALMAQVEGEYRAWRDVYVGMDRTLEQLANAVDPEEKAKLFETYTQQYETMVPVSNRLGATFDELATNNVNNTQEMVAENREEAARAELFMILVTIAGLILSAIVAFTLTRAVVRPVNESVQFAQEIASGNLTTELKVSQKDEIGVLGNALQQMQEKLKEVIASVMLGSDNIASASMQMSSGSQQVSQGASEQASSAEEVSSSMEEMAANIQQNTDNAQEADKISQKVQEGVKKVGNASQESLVSIKNIAEKIGIINDIAFQTNILALNAAVEAARAGEQGRGFAVVAAEVRKLAERSKIAADEIVALSSKSVNVTETASALMSDLIPEIEKTAKLVQEIAAASMEQTSGADQVNTAIQQLNQVTQQNAAASEEMATSAEELSSQAEQLKEIISYFRVDSGRVNKFQSEKHYAPKPAVAPVVKQANTPKAKGVTLKMTNGKTGRAFQEVASKAKVASNDSEFENF